MIEESDAATSSFSCAPGGIDLTSAVPQTMIRQRIQWPNGPSMRQIFSLPESIIYYIAKNPSSVKVYLKLVQSCKYFFEVNPILVAARIHGDTKICSKGFDECWENKGKCCINFDIKKCLSKIWLTNKLELIQNPNPNYTSLLCPKLYRSEIERLVLENQTVLLDDFKVLATSFTELKVENVKITNKDGNIVSIDEILEFGPKLKYFSFRFTDDQSTSTIKSIAKLNDLRYLGHLVIYDIPEIFSVEDFSNFIEAHKKMAIFLDFNNTISEDYKNQLDALIDTVIEAGIPHRYIDYEGSDEEKYGIVERLWFNE